MLFLLKHIGCFNKISCVNTHIHNLMKVWLNPCYLCWNTEFFLWDFLLVHSVHHYTQLFTALFTILQHSQLTTKGFCWTIFLLPSICPRLLITNKTRTYWLERCCWSSYQWCYLHHLCTPSIVYYTHTHSHTHCCFTVLCPGLPGCVSTRRGRYQKTSFSMIGKCADNPAGCHHIWTIDAPTPTSP